METKTTKGWFNGIYKLSEDAMNELKRPAVARRVKRAFESAIDNKEDEIIDCTAVIEKLRENISKGEVSCVKNLIEKRLEIKEHTRVKEALVAEMKAAFEDDFQIPSS